MSGEGRQLTPNEQKALNLVKIFEDAVDNRRMTVSLEGSKEVAEAVMKLEIQHGVCKALKVDFIPSTERYRIAFSLTEYQKYMFHMLRVVGLSLRMDGSLHTFDKLVISNEYLNEGKKNERK